MNMSHEELLVPGQRTPLLIQAGEPHRLSDYISRSREAIGEKLLRHGALLFRGFAVADSADFAEAVQALDIPLLDYRYRSTPRTGKGRGVYTATEYPADREIPLHNENAYQRQWPRKLAFCCITPAAVGGATPIADMREVRRRLDPAIFEKFARLGVRYDRVFHNMIDLSWQDAFQTDDPDEVARYCASQG
ncbi:TauD/TfdA family dioxygenase, partial [Dyella sp.]|uniref:TauD/TfdA family dioxygenase n=1 Tax=Dyella sp. TaxID=1869338 RepID=UPI002ED060F9